MEYEISFSPRALDGDDPLMPVQKFRSFEEAERAPWREPFDPDTSASSPRS